MRVNTISKSQLAVIFFKSHHGLIIRRFNENIKRIFEDKKLMSHVRLEKKILEKIIFIECVEDVRCKIIMLLDLFEWMKEVLSKLGHN